MVTGVLRCAVKERGVIVWSTNLNAREVADLTLATNAPELARARDQSPK